MSHIQRIALTGLLLSTSACRSQESAFAPQSAELPAAEAQAQAVQPDEARATEPGTGPSMDDATSGEGVASVPVAAPPETLAVRSVVRTAEHARLEALAGRFEVRGSFHPRPGSNARPVEGTLETQWIDETATLEGFFEGTLWGAPFAYVSETGFDPTLGCWVETWRTAEGAPIRNLAQGYEGGDGCIVSVRHEDGRTVRDELRFEADGIVRRVWRTTAEGVEYLSLELDGRRVD